MPAFSAKLLQDELSSIVHRRGGYLSRKPTMDYNIITWFLQSMLTKDVKNIAVYASADLSCGHLSEIMSSAKKELDGATWYSPARFAAQRSKLPGLCALGNARK